MADEGAVDVDEPTNPHPETNRPRPIVGRGGLTPVREAYGAWVGHQLACTTCRDVDAGPCVTAGKLRARWERLAGEAVRRVARESA